MIVSKNNLYFEPDRLIPSKEELISQLSSVLLEETYDLIHQEAVFRKFSVIKKDSVIILGKQNL